LGQNQQVKPIFALLIFVLAACTDNKNNKPEILHRSHAQASIENLVDSFKTESRLASSAKDKDEIIQAYKVKIDRYLSNHYLNHMRVHVDSVVTKNLTIVTRFHTREYVVFRCSLEFKKPMPPKEETLFQFMHNLKTDTDTTIDFEYTGRYELNFPKDSTTPALVISAIPLSFQIHGHR
jgi:hypothetical protein